MKEIVSFLAQNKYGNLATCCGDKPDNRPMECVFSSDKGLFFYTSQGEDLADQLGKNANICFTATDANYNYVKVSGCVEFSTDNQDKSSILEHSTFAKQVFHEDTLSSMLVFYLPHGKGILHHHGDNKPICSEF
jgi:uncharacterized pyridoxamine 5'-phosphate oxidase family protein